MSLPAIIERPKVEEVGPGTGGDRWIVTVFNNDYNGYEEVIDILMEATGCCEHEAEIETWEVHHLGKSVVHHGEQDECADVANIIAKIGIRVEVSADS